jgi:predicted DNA-binding transcriptional regulator AlpA
MASVHDSELPVFNERQAGRYVGVSAAVLRLWRTQSRGPRFFKAGSKLIRYRRTDLDAWIESRLVSGEQYGPLADGSR